MDEVLLVHSIHMVDLTSLTPSYQEMTWARSPGVGVYRAVGTLSPEPRETTGRPSSGVRGDRSCSSAPASLTLLKRQATQKHSILSPHPSAKEASGSPPQINSYFKNKRQACGYHSQVWKADLQRPKIRQKACAGDIQT